MLDRPVARLVALGVALLCIAILAWLYRADLLPSFAREAADYPFARCFAGRAAEIDGMLEQGRGDVPGGDQPIGARSGGGKRWRYDI